MPIRINGELLTDYVRRTAAQTPSDAAAARSNPDAYCWCRTCVGARA